MENSSDKMIELKKRVERLEEQVEQLTSGLTRGAKVAYEFDTLLKKHLNLHDDSLRDAFDRIKNIELKFFPHLARDMKQVYDVIGDGEDKEINPLDQRKP